MKFLDWLYSTYPNPHVNGEWGTLHITVLAICIAFIVISSLLLKKADRKIKHTILYIMAGIIFAFGVIRRIVGFINMTDATLNNILTVLLPRPGCAISCVLVILAVLINKKYFYNFSAIVGTLCAVVFFAYPGAGFNNEYILFENLYSIVTHSLFFIMSICFITYKFTDFNYKTAWREGICFALLIIYSFLQIYVLKTSPDPFYFMPENEVIEVLGGMSYALYLPLYLVFIAVYICAFYLIPVLSKQKKSK